MISFDDVSPWFTKNDENLISPQYFQSKTIDYISENHSKQKYFHGKQIRRQIISKLEGKFSRQKSSPKISRTSNHLLSKNNSFGIKREKSPKESPDKHKKLIYQTKMYTEPVEQKIMKKQLFMRKMRMEKLKSAFRRKQELMKPMDKARMLRNIVLPKIELYNPHYSSSKQKK